jgi:bifunctional DNA-binding transcriptional regulator/antitoxin component of YhaV-PrlF toxin-antitoxin module
MVIGIAQTSNGIITLPADMRDALGDADKVLVIQADDGLYLKRIEPPRRGGLMELADKLSALNEIDPITPEEIEAEIAAVRAEKRARRASGA